MIIAIVIIGIIALLVIIGIAVQPIADNKAIKSVNFPQTKEKCVITPSINPVSTKQAQQILLISANNETSSIQPTLLSNHSKQLIPAPKMVIGPAVPVVVEPTATNSIVISPNNTTIVHPSTPVRVIPQLRIEPAVRTIVAPQEPVVINPSTAPAIVVEPIHTVTIEPSLAVTVEPPKRAAWEERGWTRSMERGREIYEGQYQAMQRRNQQLQRFDGRIEVNRQNVTVYIADPPPEIKQHPHGSCFQLTRNPPWFHLHWSSPARNVDDGLLYMERVLDESINR